tara:strand:- start:110 stop:1234 length:1125 start_codon:yes stop_codon:yes gene_type:complete
MDANNFKIIKAKKIQNFYRSYKINSVINDLRNLDLKALGSSIPFSEFTIVMRKKEIINGSKLFINNLSKMTKIKVDVSNRVLLSAYLINYYAEEILDQEKNRHPIDSGILEWSQELINQLEDKEYKNFSEFKKLCLYLNNYKNIFNQWKYMDKNRTIERIIISYNNRSEHIEEIKKHKDLNEEQRKLALNELEFQRSELLKNIKLIDPSFDIEFLKNNYKKIYNDLKQNWEKVFKETGNAMKKAYYDMVSQELKKGNSIPIRDLFVEIGKRILLITPEKRKNSLEEKINNTDINSMLYENDWNDELNNHISFLADIILMFGAPADDQINKKWRSEVNFCYKFNYTERLPKVLIEMEEKLDRIYQLIINNTNNKK